MNIVDRRPNPQGKSLGNRRRFIDRARAEVKGAVLDALRKRKISEVEGTEKISIPTKGIDEPTFHQSSSGGERHYVIPGNKRHVAGDEIERPKGGGGGKGSEAADSGKDEDGFEFTLTKEEFLELFFEDLELPDLVKQRLSQINNPQLTRGGYASTGNPANLNLVRTMGRALARRISLGGSRMNGDPEAWDAVDQLIQRPDTPQSLQLAWQDLVKAMPEDDTGDKAVIAERVGKARLKVRELVKQEGTTEEMQAAWKNIEQPPRSGGRGRIPYFDPIDVRYNRFERTPKPNVQAVMFCLMDVSGSMTEHMKELAKRFFTLLHIFLVRRYKNVDIVFIRHTSTAQEVDEETFFHSRDTGGTVVSTALERMQQIIDERYPLDAWNIYAAQASDGDNFGADSGRCISLLSNLLPTLQYFAYIEVSDSPENYGERRANKTDLWRSYAEVADRFPHFVMRGVGDPSQIFPVFHDLFDKNNKNAHAAWQDQLRSNLLNSVGPSALNGPA